jgi:dimethylaniline monooxygenase (N-oxide forming)
MAGITSRRVAVVGAGAAGLVAMKTLQEQGLEVTGYEAASQAGGLWVYESDSGQASAYRTLHINSERGVTAFRGFPFPPETQAYPTHWEMAQYFADYAEHFKLDIRFSTRVTSVEPLEPVDGVPKWSVTTEAGDTDIYDAVVVANGHFAKPNHVPMLRDDFTGEYVHSHYYRYPAPYLDRRVCIVGAGNSGADISVDICAVASRTVLVARSGIMIRPKFVWGTPFVYLSLRFYKPWIPVRFRQWFMRSLVRMQHGDMTQYGLLPLTDERVHPTTNGTIIHHLAYNHITAKTGIEKIEGKRIFFIDGTDEEFDAIIAATGYKIEAPFLSDEVFPLRENYVGMYKRIASPDQPGLFFIGLVNSPEISLNYVFERQSEWLAEYLTGRALLPTREEMHAAIEDKKQWIEANYRQTNRHTIEEETMPYTDELRDEVIEGWKRGGYKEGTKLSNRLFRRGAYRRGLGTLLGQPVRPQRYKVEPRRRIVEAERLAMEQLAAKATGSVPTPEPASPKRQGPRSKVSAGG